MGRLGVTLGIHRLMCLMVNFPATTLLCSQDVVCGVHAVELISVFNSNERSINVLMGSKDLPKREKQTGVLCPTRRRLAKEKALVVSRVV